MTDYTRRRMWFLDQLDPGNPSHHVTLITTPAVVSVPDQVSDVRAAVRAEITQPFDLRDGPLVRALELNSSLLVLTMHGILGDIRVLESVLGGPLPDAPTGSPDYWLEQLRDLLIEELNGGGHSAAAHVPARARGPRAETSRRHGDSVRGQATRTRRCGFPRSNSVRA